MARMIAATAIAIGLISAAGVAAEEQQRRLGAHEHGHGSLNIAVSGTEVAMELEAPGADIAGFEHAAESDADRAALAEAERKLAEPLALFALPTAAGCRVTSATVRLLSEGGGDHAGEAHDHAVADHDEHEVEAEASHSEFRAEYRLSCTDVQAIDRIAFPYFEAFPNAEELEVQIVGAQGARSFEVEREAAVLDLDGAI